MLKNIFLYLQFIFHSYLHFSSKSQSFDIYDEKSFFKRCDYYNLSDTIQIIHEFLQLSKIRKNSTYSK